MFDVKTRYATAGIMSELPAQLQTLLWSMIEDLGKEMPLDYLQVFEISKVEGDCGIMQKIVHSQEKPEFNRVYMIPYPNPVTLKVYVIDDETHSTMLLAEEY